MAEAGENQLVRSPMGNPRKAAWLIPGHRALAGSSGSAELSIPIAGPRREASLRAAAVKSAGTWRFKQLRLKVEGQTEDIDLLAAEPASGRERPWQYDGSAERRLELSARGGTRSGESEGQFATAVNSSRIWLCHPCPL
jgi:hypothetical protein